MREGEIPLLLGIAGLSPSLYHTRKPSQSASEPPQKVGSTNRLIEAWSHLFPTCSICRGGDQDAIVGGMLSWSAPDALTKYKTKQ